MYMQLTTLGFVLMTSFTTCSISCLSRICLQLFLSTTSTTLSSGLSNNSDSTWDAQSRQQWHTTHLSLHASSFQMKPCLTQMAENIPTVFIFCNLVETISVDKKQQRTVNFMNTSATHDGLDKGHKEGQWQNDSAHRSLFPTSKCWGGG